VYFKAFPVSTFEFDGKSYSIEDLTRRVIFEPNGFSNFSYIYDIDISESRPDIVAHQLYGNVNYWWTLFVVNNITMNEWPMTDAELDDMMTEKYTDFQLEQTYRYIDDNGVQVPEFGFKSFVADGQTIRHGFSPDDFLNPNLKMTRSKYNRQTLREFLVQTNEDRKNVRAVRASYIGRFFEDFRKRVQSEVDLG
jgi:hypothetical protein